RGQLMTHRVFDETHYDSLNRTRSAIVGELLAESEKPLGIRTAIDVGCGLGYFSSFLHSRGYEVTGVEGRKENAEEAGRRVPGVRFQVMNAEDPGLARMGVYDLTLCFGLLYHLENPFLVMRHLRQISGKLLLVEAVVFPGSEPIMALVDEG